jgi:membrane protein implicated in regulation of membrane protease activity
MNTHRKKMIAPIFIVALIMLYYVIIGIILILFDVPSLIKLIALSISIIVSIILVFVLVERIKEIKGGEEDDLSKY